MNKEIIVTDEISGERLDKCLSDNLKDCSRSYIQKLLKEELIQVNHRPVKANYKTALGDLIIITIPEQEETKIIAENIPIDILYEDKDIIVINKPKGMVVHPAPGHYSGTLVNALMAHCGESLSGINGVMRPGIVHRIDKDTTGVLVVCKNDIAHQSLSHQLSLHHITRKYHTIVYGHVKEPSGSIHKPIGRHPVERKKMAVNVKNGRDAITHYKVLQYFQHYTYLECTLETGRTHQIRVHMSSIGHPLLGDNTYSGRKTPLLLEGQTLHAMILGFSHPSTHKYIEFQAPLPDYFEHLLKILK